MSSHFSQYSIPLTPEKAKGVLMFSGGIAIEHWCEMSFAE